MGSFLFANKKGVHVHLCFLPLLRDLTQTAAYSWGRVVLAQLYQELSMINLVSELGALLPRRHRAPRTRRVLYPSAPSAPSTPSAPLAPFEIARYSIDQPVVYSRHCSKRNIKTPSCGTH